MRKTKIEWCDMTWNPVTGCQHDCEYCYAQGIARRFGTLKRCVIHLANPVAGIIVENGKPIISINERIKREPFPYNFLPTFHRYRLDEPAKIKKPQSIFVCSMADLFGEWVPDEWINAVFEACMKAPQHRYLFLTKNPSRYYEVLSINKIEAPENFWFGTTIENDDMQYFMDFKHSSFISMEPLQGNFEFDNDITRYTDWVIVGAETGSRKGKVIPKKEWVENIVNYCRQKNIPVFLKNSLRDIWKEPLVQEYPWGNCKEQNISK